MMKDLGTLIQTLEFERDVETVILLDCSGVDLTPKSTPYSKKLVELQGSNAAPD